MEELNFWLTLTGPLSYESVGGKKDSEIEDIALCMQSIASVKRDRPNDF